MSAFFAVRKALFEFLEGNAVVMSQLQGIFDGRIPNEAKPDYPYMVVGDATESPAALVFKGRGSSDLIDVKIWTTQIEGNTWVGRQRASQIVETVVTETEKPNVVLNLLGHRQRRLFVTLAFTQGDPNPDLAQGVVRFQVDSVPN